MPYTPDELSYLLNNHQHIRPHHGGATLHEVENYRRTHGAYGRAALELATARGKGKLPDTWLMCSESVQQATALPVTAYRAGLIAATFPGALVHDVTCSVGTEGAALIDRGLDYVGADLDRGRLTMAASNLLEGVFVQADALRPVVSGADVIIADPARRSGGRRITDTIPPLPALVAVWQHLPLAIKCAPGIDYSAWQGLVSVVSVDGGVKETCLYSSHFGAGRQAVTITGDTIDRVDSTEPDDCEEGAPGAFILDPDGAVVRAGLVRQYAHREGLWQLDHRIAYLTGEHIPPGRSGFPFIEQVPLKKVKAALQALGGGSVEILVRGVAVDPDVLRKKWALKGSRPVAVIITRIGSQAVALICGPRTWA